MTYLEQVISKAKTAAESIPEGTTPNPLTMGDIIGAVVSDLQFLNRRTENAEVELKKVLKELQRVKNGEA